ncbi:inositol monophosphatase [Bermanella marisrubri]|uniref:Inositol-1-monophosphatase n=1 Tax=Bermanella marisrubri TaxID=207949 RepID=Q1N357_9GAMM|nr:inositol monophosphatase family protein [Bermanella marisrubri]EAT12734.1 Archaeal fructose-1,6-bisphosphatase and related enzyme of inositol monophosphatase family protein [Oceanobacter sp. RED65] [Bermanella marisrubri]QIZ85147.1 inositol monophosphatase [Bermanella marisrubri]
MHSITSTLEFAQQTAREAGELIKRLRQSELRTDFKKGIELVTNADTEADRFIRQCIEREYPDHQILAEESNPDLDSIEFDGRCVWVVDPIDGTVNYAHNHAQVAVSIALIIDGNIEIGVVYNPFTDELFHAQKSKGAFLNNRPISASDKQDLERAIIATGFPYNKQAQLPILINRLHKVLQHVADVRRLGSAALDICWVACGRLDAYYESVSLWDCAAGLLIASEAGVQCGHFIKPESTQYAHLESKHLLLSNHQLYPAIEEILRNT